MQSSAARPDVEAAVARLARRIGVRRESSPWSPPPPALLIDRIETALAGRRQGD